MTAQNQVQRVTLTWVVPGSPNLQLIEIDCSINEKHTFESTVTDHPVETGTNIADHIRPEPIKLELEGRISNTPIVLLKDNSDGAQETEVAVKGAARTVGNTIGSPLPVIGALTKNIELPFPGDQGIVKGFSPDFDRVTNVLDQLLSIRLNGYLLTVTTTLKTYDNMALLVFDATRNAESGNALAFTMQLKEIRFGATEEAPAPKLPTKKADKGSKTVKPTEEPTQSTVLLNLFGGG